MANYSVLLVGPYQRERRVFSMVFFLDTLHKGLRERGVTVDVISPVVRLGALPMPINILSKLLAAVDKLVIFPFELRRKVRAMGRNGPVVAHIVDQAYANYSKNLMRFPHIITCHDIISLQATRGELKERSEPLRTRIYQHMLRRAFARAPMVAAISATTKEHLCRLTGLDPDRVPVVYNGLHYPYHPMSGHQARLALSGLLDFDMPFFMHIGVNVWYKNREGVLDIFHAWQHRDTTLSGTRLVMVGPPPTTAMKEKVEALRLDDVVIWLSDLTNEQVCALYSAARGLIFPSFMEGFGWPIIEAMACGCPVFTSNRAPMTEIGGDAARYFDPSNPDQASHVLAISVPERESMIQAGLRRAELFSLKNMLDGYCRVYERVLNLYSIGAKN